jgi:hypothetical protein
MAHTPNDVPLRAMGMDNGKKEKSKGCAFVNACKAGNAEAVERMMRTADFQSVYNGIIAAFDNKQRYYAKWRALLKSILVL